MNSEHSESRFSVGLSTQIMIGMVLGFAFGHLFPTQGVALKTVGDVFIRMIKMIVVPLIFSSLVMGIAGTGDFKKLGRIGAKTLIWFEVATTFALVIGLGVVNTLQPGAGVASLLGSGVDLTSAKAASQKSIDLMQTFVSIVPSNIVDSMARGDMLQLVFFSTFFGVAAAAMGKKGEPVVNLAVSVAEIMFKFTWYVMKVAPIGVFALSAFTVGKFGLGMLLPMAKLIGTLYFALLLFIVLVLGGVCLVFKVNFIKLFKVIREPAMLAFTTTTSEAALPVAIENLERLGVPRHIVTFVLPTGYTFNLDGSTLYCAVAVMFVAQVYGINFPIAQQIAIMLTLMLATKGIAAVPGASLIVVAGTAASIGLPVEGIALILGIDRVLDMARTGCNLIGNMVAAVIIARWEKELPDDVLQQGYEIEYS